MIFKNVKLRLVKVDKREGIASDTKKPYLFHVGKYIDDEGNVVALKFGKKVEDDQVLIKKLADTKNVDCTVEIGVYPTGFNLKGIVQSIVL